MKIGAFIAEYNPFHNGHLYAVEEFKKSRQITHTLAIMSGNYTQRGDFACAPKHIRAEAAIRSGVDLVVEIPTVWAMSTARRFAYAGVKIANSLGVVDELAFGSERGDIDLLKKVTDTLNTAETDELIGQFLKEGISFPAAREKALNEVLGDDSEILKNPNDILATEYIRALNELQSDITPIAIKRYGCKHDGESTDEFFKSASEIRKLITNDKDAQSYMPRQSSEVFRQARATGRFPISIENFEKEMLYCLRRMSPDDYLKLPDIGNEGLENRIDASVKQSTSFSELLFRVKSKRYPLSRIRRILMSAFIGLENVDIAEVPYIRILGLNEKGAEILKAAKDTSSLPFVIKYSDIGRLDENAQRIFNMECRFTDIYSLAYSPLSPCGTEMTSNPVIIR